MENFQKTNVHYYKTFNGWNGHKLCFSLPEVGFDIKTGNDFLLQEVPYEL